MTQPTTGLSEGWDFRSILGLLWRRRWVILIPALAGLLAGLVIGHPRVLRPVYRASAKLLLDYPQPVGRELQGMVTTSNTREQLARLSTLLQSNEFLQKVAQSTDLYEDPMMRRQVARDRGRYPDLNEEELLDLRVTKWLRGAISMGRGRAGENVIVITVEDYYAERAKDLVQELTAGVIEANRSAQLERVRALHDFSLEQIVVYKERLTDAEERLEEFNRGMAVRSAATNVLDANSAAEARRLRTEASNELARRTASRDTLASELNSRSPDAATAIQSIQDADWVGAIGEVCEYERRYAQEMVTPSSVEGSGSETYALMIARSFEELGVQAADLAERETRGMSSAVRRDAVDWLILDARVAATKARVRAYDDLLSDLRQTVAGTPGKETTLQHLQEEVETNRALYRAFVQQLASSQISEAFEATMAAGRLTVLEPPSRPLSPIKPNRRAVAILSTVIGLIMGAAALLFIERHDQTYRDARETERSLGLRVLGTIPQVDGASKSARSGGAPWDASRLEEYLRDSPAYLEMRRVILQMRNEDEAPVRSLLLTSSRGAEGKTTSTILLGAAAATEDPRSPVLAVDLDLRRGGLGRMLGFGTKVPGVMEALESQRIEEAWFQNTCVPNLKVMALGAVPAPRNDLLTFENLSWFLPELTRRYGFVIIDSPPNLPVPDPLIIGQLVDAVMLVIKAGNTPRHMVERSVELQKQFTGNVRGLLMNNVNEMMPYYYSHRYYRYTKDGDRTQKQRHSG